MRRAPLLQRGGWGFESLAADRPLKLSSAEQPPCKRKAVGSIPTWGSSSPRSPTWQRHPAQTRTSRGSNPRGGTGGGGTHGSPTGPLLRGVHHRAVSLPAGQAGLRRHCADSTGRGDRSGPGPVHPLAASAMPLTHAMRRRSMAGRPAVTRTTLVRPQPSQLIPRSSNGRIFGSEPKDAWFESRPRSWILRTRTWRPRGLQHRRRGFDSFRPCSTRPGRLVGQDAGLSHR